MRCVGRGAAAVSCQHSSIRSLMSLMVTISSLEINSIGLVNKFVRQKTQKPTMVFQVCMCFVLLHTKSVYSKVRFLYLEKVHLR